MLILEWELQPLHFLLSLVLSRAAVLAILIPDQAVFIRTVAGRTHSQHSTYTLRVSEDIASRAHKDRMSLLNMLVGQSVGNSLPERPASLKTYAGQYCGKF